MVYHGYVKPYVAEGTVGRHRITKFGTAANGAVTASAATDAFAGISTDVDVAATGRLDVIKSGNAELTLGGSVTKGAFITSDANGAGVAAASGNRFIAIAEETGVSGDCIQVTISHGKLP